MRARGTTTSTRGLIASVLVASLVATSLVVPQLDRRASAATPCDRSAVVGAWQAGGPQVRAAAATALLGDVDWQTTTGLLDTETIVRLRLIQRKLAPTVRDFYRKRP